MELLAWFRKRAPSLYPGYDGCLRLLADTKFPCRIQFISHAVRDIADQLIFALDEGMKKRSRLQYAQRLDRIALDWPFSQSDPSRAFPEIPIAAVPIPFDVAERLHQLIMDNASRIRRVTNHELLLQFLAGSSWKNAVRRRTIDELGEIFDWFVGHAHFRSEISSEVSEDVLQLNFSKFEKILHSFVGKFFTGVAEIDEILRKANR
jgi:hypothetical protein